MYVCAHPCVKMYTIYVHVISTGTYIHMLYTHTYMHVYIHTYTYMYIYAVYTYNIHYIIPKHI